MEETVWKQMYLRLAGAVADAAEIMEPLPENRRAWEALNRALLEAEELYITAGEGARS
ncbi:hypothetical protein [uncultured Oscillibacter sp.]|uniref:hypothetical protein n=1 Tax=uncultured Oscillibacter sp. TaxID=876091 RepID=UPI0025FC0471|nr:hypothetical protein [uncultured Oscillibacter sp.]